MPSLQEKHSVAFEQLLWRWHFWAGLLCLPVIITLAASGGLYLFKSEYQQWHDQGLLKNPETQSIKQHTVSLEHTLNQLLAQKPGARFKKLQISQANNPVVQFELHEDEQRKLYWMNRHNGELLKEAVKGQQLMLWLKKLHGELHAGKIGSYIVELAAQWCIVLILCGLWLSYLRQRKRSPNAQAAFWHLFWPPRTRSGYWPRHWHQILGSWFAFAILLLLVSGLPWTQLWGSGFKALQKLAGWNSPGQEWHITLQSKDQQTVIDNSLWQLDSQEEQVNPLQSQTPAKANSIGLTEVLQKVSQEDWAYPITIQPPNNPKGVWSVRAMHSDRRLRKTVHIDRWNGEELMRIEFQHYHPVKQLASYGISMHEGALFGRLNQLLGALTALGLIALSLFGLVSWWKRRPQTNSARSEKPFSMSPGFVLGLLALMLFLPLFGASLIIVCLLDKALIAIQKPKPEAELTSDQVP
ncbi:PepSY-associated TM helix domain-containing protein [Pseudoteredinibacter isoporae]|uniref:Putative iron-regulated membrane protein n=1 Tax=Pseudoteredinibacter isoporae TaxID=570281 RepID=A0A7X0JSS0_9GAMM|nr:PepSY domain-containing protein [Pseudoteredinibacter isoporae]MBB6520641.1 putative iron-regulated membrane protein [Pseudoteredinibacter isoporae]NHO86208.1 PepSY domain-containing protein [Pseudoteredinibacter isoporae]NIB25341.1 PepSY domain-containing protein [Pseudoteredinibacter isoporae]